MFQFKTGITNCYPNIKQRSLTFIVILCPIKKNNVLFYNKHSIIFGTKHIFLFHEVNYFKHTLLCISLPVFIITLYLILFKLLKYKTSFVLENIY